MCGKPSRREKILKDALALNELMQAKVDEFKAKYLAVQAGRSSATSHLPYFYVRIREYDAKGKGNFSNGKGTVVVSRQTEFRRSMSRTFGSAGADQFVLFKLPRQP
jgi:hypothetical protein